MAFDKLTESLQQFGIRKPKRSNIVGEATPFRARDQPEGRYNNTEIFTYFTLPDGQTHLLYTAETWMTIRMTLETAGPVAVSTREEITPVLSGRGRLLPVGVEYEFRVPKGNRIWIAAEAVNRVSWSVAPIPWLQTISLELRGGTDRITDALRSIVAAASPRQSPKAKKDQAAEDLPCPPPRRGLLPKVKGGRPVRRRK
jgi:hypothetical protein